MKKLTHARKLRAIRWDYAGGALNSIFVELTVFGSIFIIFLNQLGIDKSQIGFILSLFPFAGMLALIIAPYVERIGYKKTFITFYGLRKLTILGLALVPWLIPLATENFLLQYMTVIIAMFAILRAIAETGFYPWNQEYIPDKLRGKISARSSLIATVTGFITVIIGSQIIEFQPGLTTFGYLMIAGVMAGLASVWCYSKIPSDQIIDLDKPMVRLPNFSTPLQDIQFRWFLAGMSVFVLATGPMLSFLPLYMTESVGLSESQAIQLQVGSRIGGLIFGLLWGWAADRYGSRPTAISGLLAIASLPLWWITLPHLGEWSFYTAFSIAILQGAAFIGWQLGHSKLLFVQIVPSHSKQDYMAFYYAIVGLIGGTSQIAGGMLLSYLPQFTFFSITFTPYLSLFIFSFLMIILTIWLFTRIHEQQSLSVQEYLRFFFYGNALQAFTSLIQYNWMVGEYKTVKATAQLGHVQSHLTVNELLHALTDPRFQVRYEAIIAMGKTKPNAKLITALGNIINDVDPALSVPAAWALGRMNHQSSIPYLVDGLDSQYASVKMQCIRSLAFMRVTGYEKKIIFIIKHTKDQGLLVAGCSYLGKVRYLPAIRILFSTFNKVTYDPWKKELVLAIARVLNTSKRPIRIYRDTEDFSTTFSMYLENFANQLYKKHQLTQEERQTLLKISDHIESEQWEQAIQSLQAPNPELPDPHRQVATFCYQQLEKDPANPHLWILWVCTLNPSQN